MQVVGRCNSHYLHSLIGRQRRLTRYERIDVSVRAPDVELEIAGELQTGGRLVVEYTANELIVIAHAGCDPMHDADERAGSTAQQCPFDLSRFHDLMH
jgi:hypothetical protein